MRNILYFCTTKHEQNNITMEAKELMIGDWVFYSKKAFPYQIKLLGENLCKLDGIDDSVDLEEIYPVLLTEKTLKKSGFNVGQYSSWTEHHTSYSLLSDKGRRIVIVDFKEGKLNSMEVYGFLIDIESHNIKSVHELQHAMRLCGIEKEIVL